jgi:hypothetical protein
MTSGVQRNLVQGIVLKVGFPLLIGLITLVAANFGGMWIGNSLELAAVVAFAVALILFIVDTEIRVSTIGEQMTAGLTRIGRLAELSAMMDRSGLGPTLLVDFLETASQVDGRVNPLLQRLARREIERVTEFVRELATSGGIAYDGEDRDWLLGLTREAERSVNAISLSTVDAGMLGFDGGLWTSDLGHRYLELQREAIARRVRIRRIFVFENEELASDETFLRITQMQRGVGVEVRMLDHQLIPEWMRPMIFDFIVFDGAVSYETTPATTFAAGQTRPAIVRTLLEPTSARVRDLEDRFEQLWKAADPERLPQRVSGGRGFTRGRFPLGPRTRTGSGQPLRLVVASRLARPYWPLRRGYSCRRRTG